MSKKTNMHKSNATLAEDEENDVFAAYSGRTLQAALEELIQISPSEASSAGTPASPQMGDDGKPLNKTVPLDHSLGQDVKNKFARLKQASKDFILSNRVDQHSALIHHFHEVENSGGHQSSVNE